MADDRERNQGMKQGGTGAGAGEQGGQGGIHQAPPRNPQEGQQGTQKQGGDFEPNKGGDKEGGQNEETRR